jgi:TonB family protein
VDIPFRGSINIGFRLPGNIVPEEPFVVVEEMPMFPGGEKALLDFLQENLVYPEKAKADSIQGKVIVRFVVNTKGEAESVDVIKGVHHLLDAEAIRVVDLMNGFKPGKQGGQPVNVWYMVPVNFELK